MISQIKTGILLGILTGILVAIGFLLGGYTGLVIGFVLAFGINFFSYWYSDKLVLKLYKAKEVDRESHEALYKAVRDVAERAKLPMPKVYIIPSTNPNAFATGRDPKHAAVAFTEGIISTLTTRELKGVIAHEMSHVKNRDILIGSIAAVIAGAISYIAMIARFGAIFGGFGEEGEGNNLFVVIALSILAPIIALIVSFAISRSREYLADRTGAAIIKDPEALADALQKLDIASKAKPMRMGNPASAHMFIVNPFSAKSLLNLFSTHPPMNKRIGKLRSMAFDKG
jgi:heat shock protein HtpX